MDSPVLRQLQIQRVDRVDPLCRLIKLVRLFCDDRISLLGFAHERARIYDQHELGDSPEDDGESRYVDRDRPKTGRQRFSPKIRKQMACKANNSRLDAVENSGDAANESTDDAYFAADNHVRACLHDYKASRDPFRLKLDLGVIVDDHEEAADQA